MGKPASVDQGWIGGRRMGSMDGFGVNVRAVKKRHWHRARAVSRCLDGQWMETRRVVSPVWMEVRRASRGEEKKISINDAVVIG